MTIEDLRHTMECAQDEAALLGELIERHRHGYYVQVCWTSSTDRVFSMDGTKDTCKEVIRLAATELRERLAGRVRELDDHRIKHNIKVPKLSEIGAAS